MACRADEHGTVTMDAMFGIKRRRGHGKKKSTSSSSWSDACHGCDSCDGCDLPCCDFGLLSTTLVSVAAVSRTRGSGPSCADRAVLTAIRGYRRVSPRLPTRCRFTPTCSAYGLEAVERHGLRVGGRLTAARLTRCRPGVAHGTVDPVP
jgi:putative membrane protein insertion efficiency factor